MGHVDDGANKILRSGNPTSEQATRHDRMHGDKRNQYTMGITPIREDWGGNLLRQDPSLEGAELLWHPTKSRTEYIDRPRTHPSITSADEVCGLIIPTKAKTIDEAKSPTNNELLKQKLNLPENYDNLTPTGKTKEIAARAPSSPGLADFLDSQARTNMLRGPRGCLRSAASGIENYVRFCSAAQATPFPVTKTTLRRWSAAFRCTKTFGLYLNHVKKASILLEQDTSWRDAEIRAIANGMANAQDRSFAFPTYVLSTDLTNLIDWETWHSPIAQVAFLSYFFSIRLPSDALQLRMASTSDKLLKFAHHKENVLIGANQMEDTEVLVAKFRFRKKIRGGCVLLRPCL